MLPAQCWRSRARFGTLPCRRWWRSAAAVGVVTSQGRQHPWRLRLLRLLRLLSRFSATPTSLATTPATTARQSYRHPWSSYRCVGDGAPAGWMVSTLQCQKNRTTSLEHTCQHFCVISGATLTETQRTVRCPRQSPGGASRALRSSLGSLASSTPALRVRQPAAPAQRLRELS